MGRKMPELWGVEYIRRRVGAENRQRLLTGIAEFDRVMGGGIVRDSVTIITSPPGGGKSTLALMAASALAKQGFRVLYASGEESDSQIKSRADRILRKIEQNIWILADTSMDRVLDAIADTDVFAGGIPAIARGQPHADHGMRLRAGAGGEG